MPIDYIIWDPKQLEYAGTRIHYLGFDVHVLRNGIPTHDMRNHLGVNFEGDDTYYRLMDVINNTAPPSPYPPFPNANDYSSVMFIPNLLGAETFHTNHINQPGTYPQPFQISTYGIAFDTNTGEVYASALAPGDPDCNRNFNFDVKVTMETSDHLTETSYRVHVHDAIVSAWMTPSAMDVIAEEDNNMFSIYAEFSEGTVGDITFHPDITWGSNSALISVANTGKFTPLAASIGVPSIEINAVIAIGSPINNANNNLTITPGTLTILDSWQNPTLSQASQPKVQFAGGPAEERINDFPNILFISEGFASSEEADFERMVSDLRCKMINRVTKRPWDLISPNMNFWSLFLPSQQSECTVRSEQIPFQVLVDEYPKGLPPTETTYDKLADVDTFINGVDSFLSQSEEKDGAIIIKAIYLKDTNEDIGTAARYLKQRASKISLDYEQRLSELVAKVGLATPSDTLASKAEVLAKWQTLYHPTITLEGVTGGASPDPHVYDDVYKCWLCTGERRLINHRNTALKLEFSSAPRRDGMLPSSSVSVGPGYQRMNRNNFDNLLKNIRSASAAAPVVGGVWAKNGAGFNKDFDFVAFLMHGPCDGGTQRDNTNNKRRTDTLCISLNPDTYFKGATAGAGRQLDLTPIAIPSEIPDHVFGTVTHELAHTFWLGDEYEGDDKNLKYNDEELYNLVPKSVVKPVLFVGDNIPWRWLRFAASGVVAAIQANAPNTDITLAAASHLTGFKITDKVRLRRRDIGDVVENDQVPPPPGALPQPEQGPEYYGPEVTIVNIKPDQNIIVVDNNPGALPVGSLLVKLVSSEVRGFGTIKIDMTTKKVQGTDTWFLTQVAELGFGGGAVLIADGNNYVVDYVDDDTNITLKTVQPNAVPSITVDKQYSIIPKEKYAEMINNSVRLAITNNNRPMTAEPYPGSDDDIQYPVLTQLTFDRSHNDEEKSIYKKFDVLILHENVVGLFGGGGEASKDVYHPTGYCAMRGSDSKGDMPFCPICRYIMVNRIDPSKHRILNEEYNRHFNPKI
ncbi:hypothetical protein CNR22_18350 [Sphingobacteriaceae bacterium]|nr:hypothetical protein CNR22_18350 [Sphingobacteriaceae bacterium]